MKMLRNLGIASILLATAGTAAAEGLCEVIKRCQNGCYSSSSRVADVLASPSFPLGSCDEQLESSTSEFVNFDLPLNWAPAPTAVDCFASNGSGSCEGWPEGESITYAWSASGGITIGAGTAANPVRNFICTRGTTGTITMTALSPQGAASSVSTVVSCP